MIQVQVKRTHERELQTVTITGHAEAGPYGYDLICAGVSAVTFGAVNAVEELCGVALDIEQSEDGGYLSCSIPESIQNNSREQVTLLLEGMLSSLRTIEASYSEHIQVNDRQGGGKRA
ncbi:uncharacterized protein YsxB (DUF464 family) [Pullulanibacillus pueri]|uniref:Ribosomal processing cysteine protease Prp n=1 Tax=Pullulanibacillus pueri TaxID=1437324 RepID=A0A8J3EN93_9BACL|nr:ribosomal-processing cysteine protease Prp [Pullulanibacillus pueri]MBM7683284.1 uncharacterized protein YsxB (DUF464 family) [Pullulanibacillus pueri]GGH85829.1 hypothetical protein GCM10007096_32130 [Pullulanibacillus pueri]